MKPSMWKLSTLMILGSFALLGAKEMNTTQAAAAVQPAAKASAKEQSVDRRIIDYVKRAISVNRNFKLEKIHIRQHKPVAQIPGWDVYFLDIDLKLLKRNGKKITVHDKIFSNGTFVARDFMRMSDNASLKARLVPDMDPSLYNKKFLLYGRMDAPNKIVAFSDPICPFCQNYMPKLLKAAKEHPDKIALFYYHFPLTMLHKAAPTVIRAIMVAEQRDGKDIIQKVYSKKFHMDTTDEKKILKIFNKEMGTHITVKDLHTPKIDKLYEENLAAADKMMINGTPTIYVNGTKDFTRQKYKKIIGTK